MCTRSVDRKYAVLLAAALTVLGAPDFARAQGYPSKFDFGVSASAQDVAAVAIAIAPDGKACRSATATMPAARKCTRLLCRLPWRRPAGCRRAAEHAGRRVELWLIGGRGTLTTKNPVMTVESYWPYATTLFDYVRRAMPFQAPGSLTADEIYAVLAYILAEGNVIDKAVVLDAQTLPRVQMPNRDGFIPDPRPELFK
jgi:cytochrome c